MSRLDSKIADALTTEDLWKMMLRRVPPIVSEYFRGGADAETTMRANVRAFQQSQTTAYGALKFPKLDMSTSVVGQDTTFPGLFLQSAVCVPYIRWQTRSPRAWPVNLER